MVERKLSTRFSVPKKLYAQIKRVKDCFCQIVFFVVVRGGWGLPWSFARMDI